MQNDLLTVIHPYLVMLLQALAAIVIGSFVMIAKRLGAESLNWLKAHTSAANQSTLESIAKEAYAFAEKFYKGEGGDEKLAAAVNYVLGKVNLSSIGLTQQDVTGAVQKAWQDYNSHKTIVPVSNDA